LYKQAKEELEGLQKAMKQAADVALDPIGQVPGVSEGRDAADAGAEVGKALGTRLYLLLAMGRDIAEYASKPITD